LYKFSGSLKALFLYIKQKRRKKIKEKNKKIRINNETMEEEKIASIVEPLIENMGYQLVRIKMIGGDHNILQIMAEKEDGTLVISDCSKISRVLSPVMDIEDLISDKYRLEVSSPGIDRPLVRIIDFERNIGLEAKIELREILADRKNFRGLIEGTQDNEVLLKMEIDGYDERQIIGIPFEKISLAKLIMTDDLISLANNN
jgi:ribosome maturation factor RimP|tara:strand:+ start:34558 stop:35160 length:603 start_codon:yes stop_codon:yes gene_type:complete